MAQEIGGSCVFTPGSYVVSYDVLDASASCTDTDALPDEYLTVTDQGTLVGTAAEETPAGCADGTPLVEGCFVAFDRNCTTETSNGLVEAIVGTQFDYAAGEGQITLTGRLYSGTTLIDACVINMEATIQRR